MIKELSELKKISRDCFPNSLECPPYITVYRFSDTYFDYENNFELDGEELLTEEAKENIKHISKSVFQNVSNKLEERFIDFRDRIDYLLINTSKAGCIVQRGEDFLSLFMSLEISSEEVKNRINGSCSLHIEEEETSLQSNIQMNKFYRYHFHQINPKEIIVYNEQEDFEYHWHAQNEINPDEELDEVCRYIYKMSPRLRRHEQKRIIDEVSFESLDTRVNYFSSVFPCQSTIINSMNSRRSFNDWKIKLSIDNLF